ncbi:Sec63 Brl domain-containing protein [Tribonema minus]|uniref:Sec63 Brl domain-containing protein n=1 Tax=Tribonema minus TaxID=303371 RepID=A0A835Z6M6_9STRA|nr:Sec63 Brl domain-containing protein [Tribonema minus]
MVESSQRFVRIVGLSATLPNYKDVAAFLQVRVDDGGGLFYFGPEHRPVPLDQTFIGVVEKQRMRQIAKLNAIAFERAVQSVRVGHQVMVFVHARKDTVRTAQALLELAAREGNPDEFAMEGADARAKHEAAVLKSRNRELRQLFASGVGCHHAGMLRSDRGLTERAFEDGGLRLLVCTATLAWGVNLPAHTVIIKGTEVYNPEKGGAEDLSILDVLQIFGRAGRPQYDTSGEAILITTHKSLDRYLALLARATPIESNFIKALEDHLNAEVAAGTVTNVREAVMWLSYTYLYVRMQKNPMAYGIKLADAEADPRAEQRRKKLILDAAAVLDDRRMIRYDAQSGNLASTDLGRAASHFYIQHESVFRFNKGMKQQMNDAAVVALVCLASEFDQIRVRPEELKDLDDMRASCPLDIKAPLDDSAGKVNVLLQSHISNQRSANFTLVSDGNYIAQNAGRVSRALFEIALRKGWSSLARRLLELSKAIDRRTWWTMTPLRQFGGDLPFSVLEALDGTRLDALLEMGANEVGDLCRVHRLGEKVLHLAQRLPRVSVRAAVQPVTRGVLRVTLTVAAAFEWHDRMHGTSEPWWIWVEDADCERIYHSEHFVLPKRGRHSEHVLAFTIPIFEPKPPQYWVRAISDRWLGCETVVPISFKHLLLPEQHPSHTSLLDLAPLPVTALQDPAFAAVFRGYTHFNPIQTQLFHVLYHTDASVLLGAPTGSGKTAVAEIAVLRMLRQSRQSRAEGGTGCAAVYIAPLKALARERMRDWRRKFGSGSGGGGGGGLGLSVLELTGDAAPDAAALRRADIIVTTPEKWDGVTRGWKARPYVHLLGEERGPVLEVIVSRMRHIAAQTGRPVRFVGLSTALANARDLADWLGVDSSGVGLYNFRPSVRPIPCEVHIQGYPGKHYCPRMATMNKPTYAAIMEHSPDKPVLVFVASRRQTRLTALDLISLCAGGDTPKQFLHMPEEEAAAAADAARDPALRHTLPFGIGIHHAGLDEADRSVVEELFGAGKLQVLVCTSTLAWGVNFPAHLVVVKGTEYFDGRLGRYVDFPVTDVLQMIGRAGRPQFDTHAVAVILVHEPKKNFLKKFLYEPFPVESQLAGALPNHINAEIAGGAIGSREDALAYMTWTYLFRRIVQNPSYYQLEDTTPEGVTAYLQGLVDDALAALDESGCIETSEDGERVKSTPLGRIASYYYLDHATVGEACDALETLADDGGDDDDSDSAELCRILADAREFAELPVRHNEDVLNAELAAELPWAVDAARVGEANTKAYLLLQAHMCRAPLPISDYANDTKSVLDQAPRVLNALVDTAALLGLLSPTLRLMRLSQCLLAAILPGADPLLQLPGVAGAAAAARVRAAAARAGAAAAAAAAVTAGGGGLRPLLRLAEVDARRALAAGMRDGAGATAAAAAAAALARLPLLEMRAELTGNGGSSNGGAGDRPVLTEGEEYEMTVRLEVAPGTGLGGSSGGARQQLQQQQQSRKGRELGWWLVLGSDADGELLAMKKVGRIARGRPVETRLKFQPPAAAGGGGDAAMTLYAVADAAAGIDAQVALPLRVVAAASAGAAAGAAAADSEWPAMVAKPPAGGAAAQRSDGGGGSGSGSAAADGDGGANGADGEGTSSVAGQDFWG